MLTFIATNPLQPLINVFKWILEGFHHVMPWGWSIIALTIVVRAALLPLTFRQFHSMQRLAHLQPELKKLQERYKNDKERMNQEVMRFYRENKVNPLASCLPLAAQFPVFISLYYMLRTDLRREICPDVNGIVHGVKSAHYSSPIPCGSHGDASFLFIHDLTDKATGATLIALIVLYVGSQLFSTLLMSTTTDRTQRLIFIALPFFFVTFVIRFPAGLLVYWITTNLWTIVQQTIIRRRLGPLRPPPQPGESSGGLFGGLGGGGGGGGAAPKPRPALETAGGGEPKGRPTGPPPSPPRRKKKRSGRRR